MSVDMAKSILDQVSEFKGITMILFHVLGEPTLHPDLLEISRYAASKKLKICITTNGSRLSRDMLHALQAAGVQHIIISLQTPDDRTFSMRGAKDISFNEYADRITSAVRTLIDEKLEMDMTISFLSSPLRRLIIPIAKEFSIADTSKQLRAYLKLWAERVMSESTVQDSLPGVLKKIRRAQCFRQNRIRLGERLSFETRIVGDWSTHFQKRLVKARFGYCPGLQENFGILWNGDYVFCCTDYEGRTSTANFMNMPIRDYLESGPVQAMVKGMQRFRIVNDHCRSCMGESSHLNSLVKQIGSVLYFKTLSRNRLNL